MNEQLMHAQSRRANRRLAACTIAALIAGVALGAGAASALHDTKSVQAASGGGAWSAEHASIPYDASPAEPAPTF